MSKKSIIVTEKRLAELEDIELQFLSFKHAGIDYWDSYDRSVDIYDKLRSEKESKTDIREFQVDIQNCHDSILEVLCEGVLGSSEKCARIEFSYGSTIMAFNFLEKLAIKIVRTLTQDKIK